MQLDLVVLTTAVQAQMYIVHGVQSSRRSINEALLVEHLSRRRMERYAALKDTLRIRQWIAAFNVLRVGLPMHRVIFVDEMGRRIDQVLELARLTASCIH